MIESTHHRIAGMQDTEAATIRRVGQVAGVLAIAIVIFASLYFLVLYIASE